MENKFIKISVDTLGSETSIENLIRGLNNSFLRNENYFGIRCCVADEPYMCTEHRPH